MPYTPQPNDILEETVVCTVNNQTALTRAHWLVKLITGVGATLQEIADAESTANALVFKPWLSSVATYYGTMAQKIFPLPKVVPATSVIGAGIGTVGGNLLPTQVRGIISLQTDLAGRAYRGRSYIPFPGGAFSSAAGHPTAGAVVALNAIAAQLFTSTTIVGAGGTTSLTPTIFHRPVKGKPKPLDNTNTPITRTLFPLRFATQRRSGDYGKINFPPF